MILRNEAGVHGFEEHFRIDVEYSGIFEGRIDDHNAALGVRPR